MDGLVPPAGVNDPLICSARTGEPFGVPVLILPDERDPMPVLQ